MNICIVIKYHWRRFKKNFEKSMENLKDKNTKILSIVVVEYFSIDEINRCIESISENVHVSYEIIVSSNSCYDDNQKKSIIVYNENVKWLFNEKNGGFAYAMNQGLKNASGDYLIIMNSDCTINSDLDQMMAFLNKHPEVGIIAPQIKDKSGNIQDTARPYVSVHQFICRQVLRILRHRGVVLERKMDYSKIQTVDWVIGAFMMVTREAYVLTNGLDEKLFMYAEDLDWCTRVREKGKEVVYYPSTTITYKGTRRARKNEKYAKIFIHSHLRYWKKFGFFFGYPKRKRILYDDAI